MTRKKIDQFLAEICEGIPNCQSVGIFFADKQPDEVYISCYQDYTRGVPSTCHQFQKQPTNVYTWFMPQVYATQSEEPIDRFVLSDYAMIPDDAPLKKYYPPNFLSVADYILWDGDEFVGWIGILSTQDPIDWEAHRAFIDETVRRYEDELIQAYREDFLE